jgi:hypothetical protein
MKFRMIKITQNKASAFKIPDPNYFEIQIEKEK